jgi:hypothetical protein
LILSGERVRRRDVRSSRERRGTMLTAEVDAVKPQSAAARR